MSDFHPQIVKIEKLVKHPNAYTLSIYTVLGDYSVVDKIGKYDVGDLATYICIDAIVPDTDKYHFLSPKKYERYEENGELKQRMIGPKYEVGSIPERYRIIKAKKFFGVYSQGLLESTIPGMQEGDSVIEVLGLKKWEEPEEENIPGIKKTRGTNAEEAPSGWSIPYYDLNSIRKYLPCVENEQDVILTEKMHGSNFSACYDGERLWIKSRNYYKKQDEDDAWWDIAIRYDLENKLKAHPDLVFFGEMVGQIKGFRYDSTIENGRLMTTAHFFDIWDTKKFRYLDYDDRVAIIKSAGLSSVPELYRGPWLGKEHAYQFAEGQSTLNSKHIREGWVLSLGTERYEPKLDSRLKLKYVSEAYNLAK